MIGKAIRDEHPNPRPLYMTVEHFFKGYPGFSTLLPKIGCVPAHPANVHRLLYDERQLVLVFPEGRKGTEKLVKDRYRVQRFGRGGFVEAAMRGKAKLQPVCVVGAEEAAPVFVQSKLLQRLTGLLYFPITPTFPWLGPLGMLGYLPAKFRIRFLEPIDTTRMGSEPARGQGARAVGRAGGARADPGGPARDGRRSASRCGSDEPRRDGRRRPPPARRVLITGLSSYWGGRLAQALEAFAEIEAIVGVDTRDPTRELERTEFVKVSNQHSLIQRIVRAARIDTVIDTRLVVDSTTAPRREAHENNVIGTMNVLAACSGARLAGAEVHLQVLGPRLRLRAGRPGLLHRGDEPLAAARRPRSSATSSRPRRRWSTSPTSSPGSTSPCCAAPTCSGPTSGPAFSRMFGLPVVPMVLGLRPAVQFVHEDDVVHALEHAAIHSRARRLQRRRATACSRSRRRSGCSASARRRCCRPGGPA